MSHTAYSLTSPGRRTWGGLVGADLVLFVLANLTAKSSSHPGAASNTFFIAFATGAVLLIALAIATALRSRRGASR